MKELLFFDLGVSGAAAEPWQAVTPSQEIPREAECFPSQAAPDGVLRALGQLHALPARWHWGSHTLLPCSGGWQTMKPREEG